MRDTLQLFVNYNSKLLHLIREKLGVYLLLFATTLLLSAFNIKFQESFTGYKLLLTLLALAMESAVTITVVFLILYPKQKNIEQMAHNLWLFVKANFWKVFSCILMLFVVTFLGMLLLIPGLLAIFFLHYAPFFVLIGRNSIKQAFINSARLARKILLLNSLIFLVNAVVILLVLGGSNSYMNDFIMALSTLYITMLKSLVYIDNSHEV